MDDLTMSAEQKTTDFMNDCIALIDFSEMNGAEEGIADGVERLCQEGGAEGGRHGVQGDETKLVDKLNPD